jgi:hypothetical protein
MLPVSRSLLIRRVPRYITWELRVARCTHSTALSTRHSSIQYPSQRASYTSIGQFTSQYRISSSTMASDQSTTLDQLLAPSILPRIYTFWFQHIPSNERLLLPTPDDWMKWFLKSDDFDSACSYVLPPLPSCIAPANPPARNSLPSLPPSTTQTLPQRSSCPKLSPPHPKTGYLSLSSWTNSPATSTAASPPASSLNSSTR